MTGARRKLAASWCYGAALLTLPWIGLGTVHLLTGFDAGAGFQPAYLFLAAALLLVLPVKREHLVAVASGERLWLGLVLASIGAILISSLGLWSRPADAAVDARWWRFGKQVFQYCVMMGFVIFPWFWTRGSHRWRWTCGLLAAGVSFQILYASAQAVHFYRPLSWFAACERWFTSNPAILSGSEELFLGGSLQGIPRLRGTACEPLYLANYLLLAIPCLFLPWSRWRGAWLWPLAALGLLLLTWARGAYLAAAIALVAALVLSRRGRSDGTLKVWWRRLALATAAAVVVVVLVFGPQSLLLPWQRLQQAFSREDWSNLTRYYSMQAGWRAFMISPIWGVGWGQYAFHFPALVAPMGLQSQFSWPVVNNFPLQILCETGLLGFSVAVLGSGLLAGRVWRAVSPHSELGRRLGSKGRARVVATAVAALGVWSQLLTFSQYNLPHIWVTLGLLLAALRPEELPIGDPLAGARPARVAEGTDHV